MEEGSWVRPALPLSLFLTLSVCTTQRLSSRKSDPQHGGWTSSTLTPKEFLRNGSSTSNWEISSSRTLQRQVPGKRTLKKKKVQHNQINQSRWFLKKKKENEKNQVSLFQFSKSLCVHSSVQRQASGNLITFNGGFWCGGREGGGGVIPD